ncbi:Prolyl oligopeptidase family, putative [Rhodospirillum centenum SW]|uniref:Prolyl oligopeptidase family, putative n=1 Tax=Rhodospirillum centenum (strain ATCC 51521 / SW) TaxID=414684 RepID=B6INU1_RHOCS|nr:Prolyl oligopeptidase family, putative [Rhodospirillum centenum SW]
MVPVFFAAVITGGPGAGASADEGPTAPYIHYYQPVCRTDAEGLSADGLRLVARARTPGPIRTEGSRTLLKTRDLVSGRERVVEDVTVYVPLDGTASRFLVVLRDKTPILVTLEPDVSERPLVVPLAREMPQDRRILLPDRVTRLGYPAQPHTGFIALRLGADADPLSADRHHKGGDLFTVDLSSGTAELLVRNPGDIVRWVVDAEDRIYAVAGRPNEVGDPLDLRHLFLGTVEEIRQGRTPTPLLTIDKDTVFPADYLRMGRGLVMDGIPWSHVRYWDGRGLLAFGKLGGDGTVTPLWAPARGDVSDLLLSADGRTAFGAVETAGFSRIALFDHDSAWIEPALQTAFGAPTAFVSVTAADATGERQLLRVYSRDGQVDDVILDIKARAVQRLSSGCDLMGAFAFDFRFITARDGTELPVYTVRRRADAAAGTDGPAIVMLHGGPQEQNKPHLDQLTLFLADRGYTVIMPDYRGSTGFGQAFQKAGFRQFDGAMLDDVEDTLAWAVSAGLARRDRVALVGGSFGSYLALAAANRPGTPYRAVVALGGLVDLEQFLAYARSMGSAGMEQLRYLGDPDDADLKRRRVAASPLTGTREGFPPTLFVQGEKDEVTPVGPVRQMQARMAAAGRTSTLVTLPEDGHEISSLDGVIVSSEAIERFLHTYLGGECTSCTDDGGDGQK